MSYLNEISLFSNYFIIISETNVQLNLSSF